MGSQAESERARRVITSTSNAADESRRWSQTAPPREASKQPQPPEPADREGTSTREEDQRFGQTGPPRDGDRREPRTE
jgi:hypothetical protein